MFRFHWLLKIFKQRYYSCIQSILWDFNCSITSSKWIRSCLKRLWWIYLFRCRWRKLYRRCWCWFKTWSNWCPNFRKSKSNHVTPGLAFVAYNNRAKARFAEVTTPRFYLDLNKYLKSQADNSTPFTPNVALFRGVTAYAQLIEEEGLDQVVARHYAIRDGLRAALKALDLDLLVEDAYASPTVTAFVPKTKDELNFIKMNLKSLLYNNCWRTRPS